jgi:phospholipase C
LRHQPSACRRGLPGALRIRHAFADAGHLPWAKRNFIDHSVSDQTSILRFIDDNWGLGRIGGFSYDAQAGTLENMFDFSGSVRAGKLILDPATGQVLDADE